jgi:hypothetical protein
LALALAILLLFGECPWLRVPFCFQRGSYESIIGIDPEKTAAAQLRFVTSLRDALTRQRGHAQSFSARAWL